MNIDDYFEFYIKTRIKYDRIYHINNTKKYDFSIVNKELIKKIFTYIDIVIFNGKLTEYCKKKSIKLRFKVSEKMTSTAGFFYYKYDNQNNATEIGFKISSVFFQNIIDNNILNMDLGVVDQNNKKYLSTTTIDPLFATMEHEIIHMLMWITRDNKHSDYYTLKSGHTNIFKKIIFNIFGHYKITHSYSVGDVNVSNEIKNKLKLGMAVVNKIKKINGYIVKLKDNGVFLCSINNNKFTYSFSHYKDLEIDPNKEPIDIISKQKKLKIGQHIKFHDKKYKIKNINNMTIVAMDENNKIWKFNKILILEFEFI
jgi:hypothetical protein